ncbi:MAG: hydroxyacylglutathione hydrolase [Gammaproteobacteria bacterium]|nr:hydroxyacylglutathione hydrolase [Gammaproteobacteria bacterium]PCH63251.1 MAG: hydroxyacylglutathione hydrolase [Gammaproteobacteria bacterium]
MPDKHTEIDVIPIPIFDDNYIWVIRHATRADGPLDHAVVVDPGDAEPILDFLEREKLTLSAVLITHKCYDHVMGIGALVAQHPAPIYGPSVDTIKGVSHPLNDNAVITITPLLEFKAMLVPGHTLGHLAFYTPGHVFVGDVMFAGGCGRIKQGGSAKQMFNSLQRLAQLPQETKIYCAHEYTLANLAFAQTVEPSNPAITKRIESVSALRDSGQPSLPSILAVELETNPFLRCFKPEITQSVRAQADISVTTEFDVFSALRSWKDYF